MGKVIKIKGTLAEGKNVSSKLYISPNGTDWNVLGDLVSIETSLGMDGGKLILSFTNNLPWPPSVDAKAKES